VIGKSNGLTSILFVSDLNIGDAVISSSAVSALREMFPAAVIDLVIKRSTACFVEGNPDVTNLFPLYEGAPFPLEQDLHSLSEISKVGGYDLIVNFSPMIPDKIFESKNVINYSGMAAQLVRNEQSSSVVNNITYQAYVFINEVFDRSIEMPVQQSFKGASIYLSEAAREKAEEFLRQHGISSDRKIVLVNPDASARFTRIPFKFQVELLRRLSFLDYSIILGSGHVERQLEHELLFSLSPALRRRIAVVPASLAIDAFAALTDLVDVFITGDTGPLHLAAARKYERSTGLELRNRTAVFSVFGGTPPHIYGYDSSREGYLAANQDAPSRTFIAKSPCRNISCINKMAKTCAEVRCFDGLDLSELIRETARVLESKERIHDREKISVTVG